MSADDANDFVSALMREGIIDAEHARALRREVGFSDADRARIHALTVILKHRHPDVSTVQIEIEATALHLAHLAGTAISNDHDAPLEAYATLVAHVVRNATIIAEEEGGREMRDAFLSTCTHLVDKLRNECNALAGANMN